MNVASYHTSIQKASSSVWLWDVTATREDGSRFTVNSGNSSTEASAKRAVTLVLQNVEAPTGLPEGAEEAPTQTELLDNLWHDYLTAQGSELVTYTVPTDSQLTALWQVYWYARGHLGLEDQAEAQAAYVAAQKAFTHAVAMVSA